MIETQVMSIGGYAFTMDAEAASAAGEYISSLEEFYLSKEGGKEIMEGIEERMAELLLEKTSDGGVVNAQMVKDVVEIIGRPEVIESESSSSTDGDPADAETKAGKTGPKKKLYRDLSDKVVAGVCSGLAIYSGIDVVIFRLAFALLTAFPMLGFFHRGDALYLSAPAIYIILWISMPAARTVKQKWSQKGQTGSIDEIQRNVMNVKSNPSKQEAKGHTFGRAIMMFIGIIFLLSAVSGLVAGGVGAFFPGKFGLDNIYSFATDELLSTPGIVSVIDMPLVHILAFGVWFLPFIGLLYAAVMMIFGFKAPSWHPGLVIFVLWLIVVAVLTTLIVVSTLQYSSGSVPTYMF
ncbi:MAG: PspC domain-containing protein [Bacteroidales bacterium]|nr:PspC domain-containing protein [Bacteroidales bacterium]